VIIHT